MSQVDIFQQLTDEVETSRAVSEQLEIACSRLETVVEQFVRRNGSGDGVRKKLRSGLNKSAVIKACKKITEVHNA